MLFAKNTSAKRSEATTVISNTNQPPNKQKIKNALTQVVIRYDVGFNNHLFIRGNGANLNWDKGIMLKNIRADEWLWETDQLFDTCEFKILINDSQYEQGENHILKCKNCFEYTPCFS